MLADLWDLVVPVSCPGCHGRAGRPLCAGCDAALARAVPTVVRPEPAPPGLPRCHALGPYQGLLKELVLGYKERGRANLARPLGERLAVVVSAAVQGGRTPLLVPVPATARAVRRRRGDHILGLARRAVERLRATGGQGAVWPALRVRPRPDSVGLTATDRLALARAAIRVRPGFRLVTPAFSGMPEVVVVDDVVTTGATVAAACEALSSVGVPVGSVVALAATERRRRNGL